MWAGLEFRRVLFRSERRVPVPAEVGVVRVGALAQPQLGEPAALRLRLGLRRVGALDHDRVLELRVARPPVRLLEDGALARREIEPRHVATLRLDVDDARVGRVLRRVEAVPAADGRPIGVGDVALAPPRRPAPGAVVLEAGADADRKSKRLNSSHGYI